MKNDNQAPKSKNTERETKVLLEEISPSVKTVAEGHSVIVRKLEEHDARFVKIESKITDIQSELSSVKITVTNVESELSSVKMAVMDVNRRVGTLEEKATDIDRKLGTVEGKLDRSLENHEKRLVKLEEKALA